MLSSRLMAFQSIFLLLSFPMAFPFQTVFKIIAVFLLWNHPLSCLSSRFSFNRCYPDDHDTLLSVRASFNYSQALLGSWVSGTDCCTWHGVTCDNLTNHVAKVALKGNFSSESQLHYGTLHGGVISHRVCDLRYLKSLDLGDNGLAGIIPPCLGNLSHLQLLNLCSNELSGSIPPSLCSLTDLIRLNLSSNELSGSIPSCLGSLFSLQVVDLYNNQLRGSIPPSLGALSSLHFFRLKKNQLGGMIPFSLGNLSSLEFFDVSVNNISGTIPSSFAKLSSLLTLHADINAFNESISPAVLPSSIESLGLSLTHNEAISESFFNNLPNLSKLFLYNCVLNFSASWIPSFQLSALFLKSCKMNGQFPIWISTQHSLGRLGLIENDLIGGIPSWLWTTSPLLYYVSFARNRLEGNLFANASTWIAEQWLSNLTFLAFNGNLLSGNIPPVLGALSKLQMLNLANNKFTGNIPSALASCSQLEVLNLGNNSLEGRIPHEFGKLGQLYSLVLHYNKLEGTFPHSITNCRKLQVLDVGHNSLEGGISKSIRHLSALRVLNLRENHFGGEIPSEIGQLMQLQILDLSSNGFSGSIPHKISCLKAMGIVSHDGFVLSDHFSSLVVPYQDELYMNSKGVYLHYMYILSSLTVVDLSNNRLNGEVPSDLGNLKGLMLLNLSRNNLSSSIPNSLGEMSQLESLDLSANRFSGKIPWELNSLHFLGTFNLSNNNLSGSIPQGSKLNTFPVSSYAGNPYLWGCPLAKNCSWPQYLSPPPTSQMEARSRKIPWYGISLGLSYGAGFGGTLTVIAAIFSQKYFEKVDMILKLLFPWLNNRIV